MIFKIISKNKCDPLQRGIFLYYFGAIKRSKLIPNEKLKEQ